MMIGAFNFNNVESSVYSLVCKSIKRPLLPAVKVRRIEPVGVSGVYDSDENEYSMRSVIMSIAYVGTDYTELRTRARSIAAWLSVGGWSKLIINDEPDKYYLAKVTSELDLKNLWESGTVEITFDCQPFAYSVTEVSESVALTAPGTKTFTNLGTRLINRKSPQGSKFKIEVAGAWTTLTLAMNGKTLNYPDAGTGTLVIDNVEMEAYLGTVNKYGVVTGDVDTFLSLVPGSNTLTIGGTGINATVTIKYIPLWL
jgi:predicted phage tail component-like protein